MDYRVLRPGDPDYPPRLTQRLGEAAPVLYCNGPLKLLQRFTIAVMASDAIPGRAFMDANQLLFPMKEYGMNYIGGWHSVIETEIFRIALDSRSDPNGMRSLTMCTARGMAPENWDGYLGDRFGYKGPFIGFMQKPEYYRRAAAGELLVLSTTEPTLNRMRRADVMRRNLMACALADVLFVPFAEKGTKTYALCKKVLPLGVPIFSPECVENKDLYELGIPAYTRRTVGKYLESLGARKGGPPAFPEKLERASEELPPLLPPVVALPRKPRQSAQHELFGAVPAAGGGRR